MIYVQVLLVIIGECCIRVNMCIYSEVLVSLLRKVCTKMCVFLCEILITVRTVLRKLTNSAHSSLLCVCDMLWNMRLKPVL